MFDDALKSQTRAYLAHLKQPLSLSARFDSTPASEQMRGMLDELVGLAPDMLSWSEDASLPRAPSFGIAPKGQGPCVFFAGIPTGQEYTSLVLALLHVSGHPPKEEPALLDQARGLQSKMTFEVYISLSCHNCPEVVQSLNILASLNPGVSSTLIDGALFQQEVEDRGVMAVPSVYLNGKPFASGRMSLQEVLAKLDTTQQDKAAAQLSEQAPFDVLVLGGGPAGCAAAVYAARKGIRTGLLAERIGGQVNDTLGIENYPGILQTEGPQFSAELNRQVLHYGVQTFTTQRAARLVPAQKAGDFIEIHTESGAQLRAHSVILSTGARWRNLNVPGEQEYKNKGVAYCPHCDGPLFKGKDVAVIGGGNSGVEAAIDLAGVARHVTLFEYAGALKADAVLVAKLHSLPNVRVVLNAQTQEVVGDGKRVTGIRYMDRQSKEPTVLELSGIFVQIGLVPNTEFLKGTVELNAYGEIVVDNRAGTSVAGVFAAGDATTAPYKQIVAAAGDGAKASLSAFDHLMRQPSMSAT